MLVKSIIAVFSLLTAAVPCLASHSLPKDFTCTPDQYYSGGYDFYQILKFEFQNETQFIGQRWWQKTTPHGLKDGQPILTRKMTLETIQVGNEIRFSGFENSEGTKDVLTVSEDWSGGRLSVISKLFENDMTFDDGHCIASFPHFSSNWKNFTDSKTED